MLFAGILFAGYAALAVPSNLVISYVGAKAWLPILTVAWGIIAAAQAAVRGQNALIALRFFLGAAEAGELFCAASIPFMGHAQVCKLIAWYHAAAESSQGS